jgi:uncharacterized membrane protein
MNLYRFSFGLSLITLISALFIISGLPEGVELPIHWAISGQADRFTDASTALLMPPIIMMCVLGLVLILKFIEPRKENIEQSKNAIHSIIAALVLFMFILEMGYFAMIAGWLVPMNKLVIFAIGVMFMFMGNFLGKVRSNFFIGIRTPWTLSSDNVWIKTHRLAGPLFLAAGLITAMLVWLLPETYTPYLILGTIIPAALIPTFYSWWLFKEENKQNDAS